MYDPDKRDLTLIGLVALFTASIVSAQLTGAKLVGIDLPVLGSAMFPAAVFAYSVTFFVTDLTGEMYGRRTAAAVVWAGFLVNFVMLALVWAAILAPNSGQGVPQEAFKMVMGASSPIVIASLVAYLISQNWDVFVFHAVRERTGTDHLWVRNLVSTATSQFIDSAVFLVVAFSVLPTLLGVGVVLPPDVLVSTLITYWVIKVAIALGDTPFVYFGVYGLEALGFNRANLRRGVES